MNLFQKILKAVVTIFAVLGLIFVLLLCKACAAVGNALSGPTYTCYVETTEYLELDLEA